ncbi:hypothetical protein FQN54_007572 [Arachnomyces sp. PD_36]|nr:hypothetical protein FQN54_007572 [Arachnomyces sp. PD_36]
MTWELPEQYQSSSGTVRWKSLGSGPAVVLNHGTPFSSYVWRDIAAAISSNHTVYLWDMPGYGTSAMFEGQDVSLSAQGKVFTELLAHWGLENPLVVAHDFGGAVALRAHLLHGAKYRALTLVDPVALAPWGSPFFRLVGENASVFERLPPPLHEALVRKYISSASYRGIHPTTMDALVAPWTCGENQEGQGGFYRQIAQASQVYTDEVQVRYHEVTIPTLVCWGTDDEWIPVAKAHELTSLIPGSKLRLIEGAGHLVQEDSPAQLTAAIVEFLAGFGRE